MNTEELNSGIAAKVRVCQDRLTRMQRVAVAVSGGVDSSCLLALAVETLSPANVLGIKAVSPLQPSNELDQAKRIASRIGVELVTIETDELNDPDLAANPSDRCYICKKRLFGEFWSTARERGFSHLLSGANADDPKDYRPGMRAEQELGIDRPLMDAGLTKADIRMVSKALALPTWNHPSSACLASRIPYGQAITLQKLQRIDRAEALLRTLGLCQCRVRDHDTVARIEVQPELLPVALENRERIVSELKTLGYSYVTVDLEGFRSGAMNEVLS